MDDFGTCLDCMVILKFTKEDLSLHGRNWLLSKLTTDGKEDSWLKCDPIKGTDDLVYHVWIDNSKLAEEKSSLSLHIKHDLDRGTDSLCIMERQYNILDAIASVRFLSDDLQCKDLPTFHRDQSIFSECKKEGILTYFPVHCAQALKNFEKNWVKRVLNLQPPEEVFTYFGDSIAMYFSFIGFYTKCLIAPAIIGLTLHIISLLLSVNVECYFSLFNVVWCTGFFVLWRRKSTSLAYQWGSLNYTRFDKPRPEFKGDKIEEDPVTHKMEPVCNYMSKYYRFFFGSVPIITLFLMISVVLGFIYIYLKDFILWMNYPDSFLENKYPPMSTYYWLLSILLTVIYAILSLALDLLYRKVAFKLNNWENHRNQQGYDNFLIAKLVVFNFVNYFHILFYIAFYIKDLNLLRKDLATLLIINQITDHFMETLLPFLKYKAKKNLHGISSHLQNEAKMEDSMYQTLKDLSKEEYLNTLDDYLKLFLQFGYVFLFSAVYPLAALWALLGCLLEIRMDAFKFCFINRKPIPQQCDGIGSWLIAFELLSVMAVITNCSLIATNEDVVYYFKNTWNFNELDIFFIFVIIEHILLFVKMSVLYLSPNTPHWVKIKLAERDYKAYQALKNRAVKSDSSCKDKSV